STTASRAELKSSAAMTTAQVSPAKASSPRGSFKSQAVARAAAATTRSMRRFRWVRKARRNPCQAKRTDSAKFRARCHPGSVWLRSMARQTRPSQDLLLESEHTGLLRRRLVVVAQQV